MLRTYAVVTYGCQMNVHDSERLTGLLEEAGYAAAPAGEQADVVVFNTCAVRENADNRLYGNLGHLAPVKAGRPGMQIAVGGCLAQKDRDTITRTLDRIAIRNWFDTMVTAEDTPRHKPDPDVFLEAARRLRVEASKCVVFEDTDIGLEAARRAGMFGIDVRPWVKR